MHAYWLGNHSRLKVKCLGDITKNKSVEMVCVLKTCYASVIDDNEGSF